VTVKVCIKNRKVYESSYQHRRGLELDTMSFSVEIFKIGDYRC